MESNCNALFLRLFLRYFIGGQQVAQSLEDTDSCCRIFCTSMHPFNMNVKDLSTDASLLELDRYQKETITSSNGEVMGSIKETFYYWYVILFKLICFAIPLVFVVFCRASAT